MNFRQTVVVNVLLQRHAVSIGALQRRIVGEIRVLKHRVDRVQAKAVDAPLVPEAGNFEHFGFDFRIAPVQIGLLGIEVVVVPLLRGL